LFTYRAVNQKKIKDMTETRFRQGTSLIFFLIRDDQQKDMMYYVNLLESQLRNWKGNISCGCRMIKPFFMVNDDVVTTDWTQRK